MKTILLKNGQLAKVDDDNYDRLNSFNWNVDKYGYAMTGFRGKIYKMHQLIIGKAPMNMEIHHKDKDKLNNQESNLEFVPKCHGIGNLFGYKGVSQHGKKFRATIRVGRKSCHIGSFNEVEDAARAYDKKAIEMRGPNTTLNFPHENYAND